MSASLNRVELIGRLTADPDLTYSAAGVAICNFDIATERGKGEHRVTDYHKIVVFGRQQGDDGLAGICAEHLTKGSMVFIEARQQTRKYEKDGVTHEVTQSVAHNVQFLRDTKRRSEQ